MSASKLPKDTSSLDEILFNFSVDVLLTQNFVTISQTLAHCLKKTLDSSDHALDYQGFGFDPCTTLKIFYEKSQKDTDIGDFTIKTPEGKEMIKIQKKGNFSQDMALFVLLFVTKGANWEAIRKNTNTKSQWVEVYDYKVSKYGILSTKPSGGYRKDDLTIDRLASCVPYWVLFFCHEKVARELVDLSLIERASGYVVPYCFRSNMLPPVLPKMPSTEGIKYYCYMYSYLLDRAINPNSNKKISTLVNEITGSYEAAHDSKLIPNHIRKTLCRHFDLISTNDPDPEQYNNTVTAIGKTCEELWRNLLLSKDHDDFTKRCVKIIEKIPPKVELPMSEDLLASVPSTSLPSKSYTSEEKSLSDTENAEIKLEYTDPNSILTTEHLEMATSVGKEFKDLRLSEVLNEKDYYKQDVRTDGEETSDS